MAISLCIKGREEMTEKIIIKPSVQKRFDSFMVHGRVLFSARPAALERPYWRTRCCAGRMCCGKVRQPQTGRFHRQRRIGTFC